MSRGRIDRFIGRFDSGLLVVGPRESIRPDGNVAGRYERTQRKTTASQAHRVLRNHDRKITRFRKEAPFLVATNRHVTTAGADDEDEARTLLTNRTCPFQRPSYRSYLHAGSRLSK